MYLLDTNACIRVLNGTSAALVARLEREGPARVRLSAVVMAELSYGARRSSRPAENLRLLDRFSEPFVTVPFDQSCADHCGQIRAELERVGTTIGPIDLLIAATARANGLVMVTHGTGEFSRVVGLGLADWEAAGEAT